MHSVIWGGARTCHTQTHNPGGEGGALVVDPFLGMQVTHNHSHPEQEKIKTLEGNFPYLVIEHNQACLQLEGVSVPHPRVCLEWNKNRSSSVKHIVLNAGLQMTLSPPCSNAL